MASNTSTTIPDLSGFLPPSLNLPPHLSAHKYFFVCTLTVAAWDTLVLSPRTWRLVKTKEWPLLKIIFNFLRIAMPAELIVVAVAFFDTHWTAKMCSNFYLFEPIATLVLISVCAVVHVIRISAIYDQDRFLIAILSFGLLSILASMSVATAFFRPMPLKVGQGCIAGPRANWVGIYWLVPTVFFTTTFALATARSIRSLKERPLSLWKLMLRDGLNLYFTIWAVNTVNVLFWFIAKPTDSADTIKTIVTSMAMVLTVTMTLRIILSVRGTLALGGVYPGSFTVSGNTHSHNPSASRTAPTTHVITQPNNAMHSALRSINHTGSLGPDGVERRFSVEDMRGKADRDWESRSIGSNADEPKGSVNYTVFGEDASRRQKMRGVKVTVDRATDF